MVDANDEVLVSKFIHNDDRDRSQIHRDVSSHTPTTTCLKNRPPGGSDCEHLQTGLTMPLHFDDSAVEAVDQTSTSASVLLLPNHAIFASCAEFSHPSEKCF